MIAEHLYVNQKLVLCYNCREVANVAFDDLPSSRSGAGRYSCDVCTKNGVYLQDAKVFCTICCLKYCADHEKVHCRILQNLFMVTTYIYVQLIVYSCVIWRNKTSNDLGLTH